VTMAGRRSRNRFAALKPRTLDSGGFACGTRLTFSAPQVLHSCTSKPSRLHAS
jgi:hypothetical protein